ncbi:MAG: phosphoribosyltransferase [Niabella sp.]|nr:MAG: phosphoribosyltransferase [Niabella sp.]
MKDKNYILSQPTILKKLNRLALEIIEHNIDEKELIFVGIEPNGVILAKRLKANVEKAADVKVELLTLKLNKSNPDKVELNKAIEFNDKVIVVIDDVTNSGKTLLYSMKPFLEHQPKKIQVLVLVERTHTLFPILADYKGFSIATTLQEHIVVTVEGDEIKGAYLR